MFHKTVLACLSALVVLSIAAPGSAVTTSLATTSAASTALVGQMEYYYCAGQADIINFAGTNNGDGTWTFVITDIGPCDQFTGVGVFMANGSPETGFNGPGVYSAGWTIANNAFTGYATMQTQQLAWTFSGPISGSIA